MSDTDNEFQRGYEAFAKTASSHIAVESAVQSTEWVAQVVPRSNKPASADITTNFGKRF